MHDMGKWVRHQHAVELPLVLPVPADLVLQHPGGGDVLHRPDVHQLQGAVHQHVLRNFAILFYVLVARDAKRNPYFLIPVCFLIFCGHYTDVYLLVVLELQMTTRISGFFEWGTFLGFSGCSST